MEMHAPGTAEALDVWPTLAAQMGLDPGAFRASVLARRDAAHAARLLLRMDGPGGPFVLKRQARPETGFAEEMAAHVAAAEAFATGVPPLLAVDLAARACVMGFAPGAPLAVRLEGAAPLDQAALLGRAGAWLDGWHRATLGEQRVFQPKHTCRHLRRIRDEVTGGARRVAEPTRFLACLDTLLGQEALYEGQKTWAARTHGDLHARNLVIDDEGSVQGIDFAPGRVVPVGHDIARLLVDVLLIAGNAEEIPEDALLSPGWEAGFFSRYGLVAAQDRSVRMLVKTRLLAEWLGLPADPEERSLAQALRFGRLMTLVPSLLEGAR